MINLIDIHILISRILGIPLLIHVTVRYSGVREYVLPAEPVCLYLVGTLSALKIPKTVSLSVFIFWSDQH